MSGYGRDESAPTPSGMFATNFVGERNIINKPLAALRQTVSSIIADRQQRFGKPQAAVGADLSCPHIPIRNAFAIRWNTFGKPSAVLSQTTSSRRGPIHRAHIYVFAMYSQSVGTHLAIRQQHYRKPFAAVGADLSRPHI